MTKSLSIVFVVGVAGAFLSPSASAQPKVHDNRKAAKKPYPVVQERDHRHQKAKAKARDHKDHRKGEGQDHKHPGAAAAVPAGPRVHDKRTVAPVPPGPRVHDKRTVAPVPPGPRVHDKRIVAPVPPGPRVHDKRTSPIARDGSAVPSHGMRRRPRNWRNFEMPVINRYFPAMGAVGTSVTIDGANFTPGYAVFIGDTAISDAATTPSTVTFRVPEGTVEGLITLRSDRRRIAVGTFKVAQYDARAERRKRRMERRKSAEADWKRRKKDVSKNRQERLQWLSDRETALSESREERRQSRHAEIRAAYEARFLADPDTVAELALHAERLARLQRMERLAEANDNGKLMVRITVAIADEDERHKARTMTLKGAFEAR